jgi:hypothetical protein
MEFAAAETVDVLLRCCGGDRLDSFGIRAPVPGGIENVDSVSISDMISDAGRILMTT